MTASSGAARARGRLRERNDRPAMTPPTTSRTTPTRISGVMPLSVTVPATEIGVPYSNKAYESPAVRVTVKLPEEPEAFARIGPKGSVQAELRHWYRTTWVPSDPPDQLTV